MSALTPGSRLGPYEVGALLGVGGMGEVYRATDTNLKRQVAIKVLPALVAADPERLARFQREAEILAALNHPNIAHIHGLEKSDGTVALVMELVEGPTLAHRIAKGAIPIADALPIAKQIAEALEAAHEQGIIHRDLKPANIKVREDGTVKVLDFGLAKAMEPAGASSPNAMNSPTISMHATQAGILLGTAAYMSPEQARGGAVDKRADLWAFGVVLYEMLTGTRPFDGATISDALAHVLTKAPDWTALPASTPAPIRRLLRRCLEKDRKRRLPDAADIRLEIEEALTAPVQEASPRGAPRRVSALRIVLALAGTAFVATLATWGLMRAGSPAPASVTRFTITPPPGLPLNSLDLDRDFALAPDGSFLVYRAGSLGQLVVRRLDRLDAWPLAGVVNARAPFVSPDSRWIGFVEDGITLKKVAVSGGAPVTLARPFRGGPLRGACWIDDTTIVVATSDPTKGLLRVPAEGGEASVLTTPDRAHGELSHVSPSGLLGGRLVLFTIAAAQPANDQIALLDLQTGRHTTLIHGGSDAQYVSSGHLAYSSDGALYVVRFDPARRVVVGDPVRVVEGIAVAATGASNVAVTRAGTLVYVPSRPGGMTPRSLVWVDRQGHETPIPAEPRAYLSARLSPDGTRVLVDIRDQEQDIWVWDLMRRKLTRLTFGPALDRAPVWTPDSRHIVFGSTRVGTQNLYVLSADGTGADVRLTTSANAQIPSSITPDGAFVIASETRPQTGTDIVRIALDGVGGRGAGSPAAGLLEKPAAEHSAEVSPDGRFMAYQSDESGRIEVYVRPYPQVENGLWLVSTGGGRQPAWTRGGRELVYLDAANHLTSVEVETTGSTFRAGTPATLFTTAYAAPGPHRPYDVSPDGQRFLMIKEGAGGTETAPPPGFVVVQNWFEDLKRLVPTKER